MRNLPLALLIAWFVFDLVSPRFGMTQVSVMVWQQDRLFRAICALALVVIAGHLYFRWDG